MLPVSPSVVCSLDACIEGWEFAKYHDCSQSPQVVNFISVKKLIQMVKLYNSFNELQLFLYFNTFLDFHRRPTTFIDMATIAQMTKLRVVRKGGALGLLH